MRKTALTIVLALVLALSVSAAATSATQAVGSAPVGNCPNGFMPMDVMDHDDHEMEHQHAGITFDLNGNGVICMREVTPTIHVHVDDVVR